MWEQNRRLIILGAVAAIMFVIWFVSRTPSTETAAASTDTVALAEHRLAKLRQMAAQVPGREQVYKQASLDLSTREKTLIKADSAALAQEKLLEIVHKIAAANAMEIRTQDLAQPKLYGKYGEVAVTLQMQCRIEQLVNFLSDLTSSPESVGTEELHVFNTQPEQKIMQVRLTVAGLMPASLVPKKKETVF